MTIYSLIYLYRQYLLIGAWAVSSSDSVKKWYYGIGSISIVACCASDTAVCSVYAGFNQNPLTSDCMAHFLSVPKALTVTLISCSYHDS